MVSPMAAIGGVGLPQDAVTVTQSARTEFIGAIKSASMAATAPANEINGLFGAPDKNINLSSFMPVQSGGEWQCTRPFQLCKQNIFIFYDYGKERSPKVGLDYATMFWASKGNFPIY